MNREDEKSKILDKLEENLSLSTETGAMRGRELIREFMVSRRLLNNEVRSFKFKAWLKKDNLSVEQRMENARQLKQQFSWEALLLWTSRY